MFNIITNTFQNQKIRIVIIENEPWFIAKDVAEILGYIRKDGRVDTNAMTRKLDKQDIKEIADDFSSSSNKSRKLAIINESGLYNSIFSSKLETAKDFTLWVTRDVLPSIRKRGSYQIQSKDDISELENSLKVTKIASQFLDIFHKKNKLQLLYLDNFVKSETGNSIIEKFGIDLKNQFFLPTELGNFIGKSGMEINQIFANFGFQEKTNGVWKLLERGQEFGSVFQNSSNLQIKWKLSVLEKI